MTQTDHLYHFTCKHSKAAIGTGNCLLIPQIHHPMLGCKVLWLTTEAEPDRQATGLTMDRQKCDRMEFRYVVTDLSQCRPWINSPERARAPRHAIDTLESLGDPAHWWIASVPVRAQFDRSWRHEATERPRQYVTLAVQPRADGCEP